MIISDRFSEFHTRFFPVTLATLIAMLSLTASAREFSTEEKLSDLNQLATYMRAGYGPLYYKKDRGLDLDAILANYSEKAKATTSNGEFYYLVNQFAAEFQDGHFRASVPTSESASLPFSTDLIDGKVLINDINRALLPQSQFPFQIGDEIVEFAGKPVKDVVNELARYFGTGYALSSKRMATMRLTARSGTRSPVPSGEVTLKIRRGTSKTIEKTKLSWIIKGTPLDEAIRKKSLLVKPGDLSTNYRMLAMDDIWQDLFEIRSWSSTLHMCSGTSRIAPPKNATIISPEPLAYYYPTKKGNIGYLRIPHYSPKNEKNEDEFLLRFAQYEFAVDALEKNTIGLIIDQDHNCGGNTGWLQTLLGLFMLSSYSEPQFQMLGSKEMVMDLTKWSRKLDENTLEHAGIMKAARFVKDTLEHNKYLTPIVSISGLENREPHSVHYTKPIIVLIDELSGSGGELFPAMLKDHGRAKLLGTRTMGAAGHVITLPPLQYSQVNVRMTKSLLFRPDGVAIENNGVMPDFQYTPTRDDLLSGYKNYQAFYTQKMLELIKANSTDLGSPH